LQFLLHGKRHFESNRTQCLDQQLNCMYGIYGFCYYHYWFRMSQVLERPVNEIWKSGEPDFHSVSAGPTNPVTPMGWIE
jgi:hypothetical protein